MPRITPQHWKRLVKVFEQCGYVRERENSSHYVMSRPGSIRPIIIPKYNEVGIDIIKNNMRTSGLSPKEYLDILQNT